MEYNHREQRYSRTIPADLSDGSGTHLTGTEPNLNTGYLGRGLKKQSRAFSKILIIFFSGPHPRCDQFYPTVTEAL
ncbi:unnamed protein product [Nezara viridula]|uniref:Uncharacterized protein n=1 Tax=Nezara viridula TaxID=85310 RepID=A0A9P0HRX6_NEZVI|nr:unnamed protein product [Nezara viridula]